MTAKQTATTLLNELDDSTSWSKVKDTIMKEYKRETWDAKVDALAAVLICGFVSACIFWVSSQ